MNSFIQLKENVPHRGNLLDGIKDHYVFTIMDKSASPDKITKVVFFANSISGEFEIFSSRTEKDPND